MGIADRIRSLCEANGMTINKLEKLLGIGRGNIARWDKHKPSVEKVQAVANYFGVSTEYILTGEEKKPVTETNLTDEQQELVKLFDSASPELRAAALAVLRAANGEK